MHQKKWHTVSCAAYLQLYKHCFVCLCFPLEEEEEEKCKTTKCALKSKARHQQLLHSQCLSDQGCLFPFKAKLSNFACWGLWDAVRGNCLKTWTSLPSSPRLWWQETSTQREHFRKAALRLVFTRMQIWQAKGTTSKTGESFAAV